MKLFKSVAAAVRWADEMQTIYRHPTSPIFRGDEGTAPMRIDAGDAKRDLAISILRTLEKSAGNDGALAAVIVRHCHDRAVWHSMREWEQKRMRVVVRTTARILRDDGILEPLPETFHVKQKLSA